ncbi:TPA: BON domain-containing protein [Photobacterium damselae]
MRWKNGVLGLLLLTLFGCSTITGTDPRSLEQQWQDERIAMDISGLANSRAYYQKVSVTAIALSGKVLLIGQVTNPATQHEFLNQVKKLNNVRTVYNQTQIGPLLGVGQISSDSWLTTKVKSQLIGSKRLSDAAIEVYSENGTVYLVGYVTSGQRELATNIARNVSGVKRVVTMFEEPK